MVCHRYLANEAVFQPLASFREDAQRLARWDDSRSDGFLHRHPIPECWDDSPDDLANCYRYYHLDWATCYLVLCLVEKVL